MRAVQASSMHCPLTPFYQTHRSVALPNASAQICFAVFRGPPPLHCLPIIVAELGSGGLHDIGSCVLRDRRRPLQSDARTVFESFKGKHQPCSFSTRAITWAKRSPDRTSRRDSFQPSAPRTAPFPRSLEEPRRNSLWIPLIFHKTRHEGMAPSVLLAMHRTRYHLPASPLAHVLDITQKVTAMGPIRLLLRMRRLTIAIE